MSKATHIFVLIVVLGLLFMQISNKQTIKDLQVKLDEMKDECVVARDVESPILIIGIPEEK